MSESVPVLVVGGLLLLFVLYVIHLQLVWRNKIILDGFRFKYFALRDRLAILVTQGAIKEDSVTFQAGVDMINFHIVTLEHRSVDDFIGILIAYHQSTKERRLVEEIRDEIDNPEAKKIIAELFNTTEKLIRRNSIVQLWLIRRAVRKHQEVSVKRGAARTKRALDNLHNYSEALST